MATATAVPPSYPLKPLDLVRSHSNNRFMWVTSARPIHEQTNPVLEHANTILEQTNPVLAHAHESDEPDFPHDDFDDLHEMWAENWERKHMLKNKPPRRTHLRKTSSIRQTAAKLARKSNRGVPLAKMVFATPRPNRSITKRKKQSAVPIRDDIGHTKSVNALLCHPTKLPNTGARRGDRRTPLARPTIGNTSRKVRCTPVTQYVYTTAPLMLNRLDSSDWASVPSVTVANNDDELQAFLTELLEREITPEDYERLLELDQLVKPKTCEEASLRQLPSGIPFTNHDTQTTHLLLVENALPDASLIRTLQQDDCAICMECLVEVESDAANTQNQAEDGVEHAVEDVVEHVMDAIVSVIDNTQHIDAQVLDQTLGHMDSTSHTSARLLKCGHVFHKACIDQWLLNNSDRCPLDNLAVS